MAHRKDKNPLLEEKLALSAFFDSLLHESEEYQSDRDLNTLDQQLSSDSNSASVTKLKPNLPTLPLPTPVPFSNETEHKVLPVVESKHNTEFVITNKRSESLQILMFNTAGLNLAAPLIELSGVLEWPDNITEMPGHADFYLGLMQYLGQQIPLIDLAQVIIPADKLAVMSSENRLQSMSKIVLIDNAKWGLACDTVQQVITVNHNQVRWREKCHTRPWFAGTVIDHMCALLDTTQLARLLYEGQEH